LKKNILKREMAPRHDINPPGVNPFVGTK
jgi:hypothetical protein